MRLKDKTILITAAGQGMGRASAIACAAEGATVWATDRDAALLAGLEDHGIRTSALDVTDADAIAALAADLPPLDGLFNCAGIVVNGTLESCTVADWDLSFAVNVNAMFHVTRAMMPGLLQRAEDSGTSVILNMASVAGSVRGLPNRCAYGASKAAVIGLTKSIAADYIRTGLRANCLCPGTVDTPSLRGRIAASADPVQAEKDFIARQPMGRLASVEDMTPIVIYLLSDESRFMTGQAVSVDGGMTI